jgi:hypothetical protein
MSAQIGGVMNTTKPVDLLALVGDDNYTVPQYIEESKRYGVSKRVALNAIPEGIVPGVSRLFLWHTKAIPLIRAYGCSLRDVVARLMSMGAITQDEATVYELGENWSVPDGLLEPSSYVPPHILVVTCAIQRLEPGDRRAIERDFEIEWQGGIFSWCYLGQVQMVLPDDATEDDIPEDVRYRGDIDFVKVEYVGVDDTDDDY